MISEIRYVVRSLIRRKGFALVIVLTLALGIGSATAIYAVVDWILFQAPPSPKDLYVVGAVSNTGDFMPINWEPQLEAYSTRTDIFSEIEVAAGQSGNVVVDRDPVGTSWEAVSLNFFKMMNVAPFMGRGFVPGDNMAGRDNVVVVSHDFWAKHLGGSQEALGRKIILNQEECTVIGILKEGQRLPAYSESAVFRPFVDRPDPRNPFDPSLIIFGRMRPGVSLKKAEIALAEAKVNQTEPYMGWFVNNKPGLETIADMDRIFRPEMYWMMLGAVGFLFAIACLNATNLMLVHMVGKQLETGVRLALGGGHWGILRLLLIETAVLCLCGSLLGGLIANWLVPLFTMVASSGNGPGWASWNLGWRTYLVLGGVAMFAAVATALVPGVHVLRSSIQGGLKNGGGAMGESPRVARVRGTFVVLQAMFAVILLVGAGLMIRTFARLEDVKLGFDPGHRVKLNLSFPSAYPSGAKERNALLDKLHGVLARVPGVTSVGFGSDSLLAGYESVGLDVESANGSPMNIHGAYVSPDYQKASGVELKEGRWLTAQDKNAVMINESLARVRFGSADPLGLYLRAKQDKPSTYLGWAIVGVVGDVRENMRMNPGNKVYMPSSWSPATATTFFVDMSAQPSGEATARLSAAVYQFDPRIVTFTATPLADKRREQLSNEHLALSVLRVLSAIAVLLTIVGLFSVLAYSVDRRMGEFGIRMALGATPGNLISLVMRRGMALTAIGVAAGIGGAMALTRYMRSLLFETAPYDPAVITAVAGLLLLSALAACALPAVRASRPDVARLLKGD